MSPEQELLAKWRGLPKDKQEEVLDFVEFLRMSEIPGDWKSRLYKLNSQGKGFMTSLRSPESITSNLGYNR